MHGEQRRLAVGVRISTKVYIVSKRITVLCSVMLLPTPTAVAGVGFLYLRLSTCLIFRMIAQKPITYQT